MEETALDIQAIRAKVAEISAHLETPFIDKAAQGFHKQHPGDMLSKPPHR